MAKQEEKVKPELRVDTAELRSLMGRANISQAKLARISGVHRNTISKVLRTETADLTTVAALTDGLNKALEASKQEVKIGPFDLLDPIGFPSPQVDAQALPVLA